MRSSSYPQTGRRAADRDAFRVALTDALRALADPAAIEDAAAELLGRYLHATRAYHAELDDRMNALIIRKDYADGASTLAGRYPVEVFGRAMVTGLAAGRPIVTKHTLELKGITEAERESYIALDSIAVVAVPIFTEGRWTGVLVVAQNEPRSWSDEEIALIAETAERARAAAQRARSEAEVRASEQRFRSLFASIDQGIALIELVRNDAGNAVDYGILEANERCSGLGNPAHDEGGATGLLVFDRDPYWLGVFDRVARTGEPTRFDRYVPSIDRWYRTHVRRSGGDGTDQVLVVFDDITERRLVEIARKKTEERQAYLLELTDALRPMGDPIAIQRVASELLGQHLNVQRAFYCEVAPDDRHLTVYREFRRGVRSLEGSYLMSSYGPTWIKTLRSGARLVVSDTELSTELTRAERDAYATLEISALVAVPLIKDGRWVACLVVSSSQPRVWSDDDVSLVQETGDRTWAALERAQAEHALLLADRRKDQFLMMLAHELRNPLGPIRNSAEILKVVDGGIQVRRAAEMVQRQVGQLARLVDDLLDVSRISRGKFELRRERVDLASALRQAVERIWPQVKRNGHSLSVNIPTRAIQLDADPARLAQIMDNLLQNAVKFMDRTGRIELVLVRYGNQAVIQVRDTGIGIPADHLPSIFELFKQVDTSLERAAGGLGIGLTLVRRLVELHGGSIDARSDGLGKGSEFTVRLPVLPDEVRTVSVRVHAPAPAGPPRKILIVDDNRDSATSLATLLRWGGHETCVAHDGLEALELAKRFLPDVALLDIGLPKLNGYETCRRMRAEPWGRAMVLVALTGWGHEESRRHARSAGFDHHIIKPVDPERLAKLFSGVGADDRSE